MLSHTDNERRTLGAGKHEQHTGIHGTVVNVTDHLLDNTHFLPTQRLQRLPQLQQQPLPQPQPQPAVTYSLVSDYDAQLAFAEMLMQDAPPENLQAAALGHLSLDSIVPVRSSHSAPKYANAPSRAHIQRRIDTSSRFDRRPVLSPAAVPSLSHSTTTSPATSSARMSLPADQPSPKTEAPEEDKKPAPSPPPTPAPTTTTAVPTITPITPALALAPTLAPPTSTTPNTAPKRAPGRTAKRSPAPRRQECQTCGKKFQRPCQLTTHIRSHTGEQPHACPVCSRRFSVLSNCQRHVKLCQKRSAKVVQPGDDDVATEPAAFIQYPNEPAPAPAENVRRPNEIPIRPKLSRASGSGSSVAVGASGSNVGLGLGVSETNPGVKPSSRAGSGSLESSPAVVAAPKKQEMTPPVHERQGSGSVPVVPSSPAYPLGGSFEYTHPARAGYFNRGFESGYSGQGYGAGYGQTATGYDQSGYERPSAYGSGSAYGQSSSYEQSYTDSAFDRPGSSFSYSSQPSPSHIQPLASPSHIQQNASPAHSTPAVGSTPLMYSSSVSHPASMDAQDASTSSSSYFPTVPGLYARSVPTMAAPTARRPSIPTSTRSAIVPSLVQRDALGLLGQRDMGVHDAPGMGLGQDAMASRPSDAGAGPPAASGTFSFPAPSVDVVGRAYEAPPKADEGANVATDASQAWTRTNEPQRQDQFQGAYSDRQWTGTGTETSAYHTYHPSASSDMPGPHDSGSHAAAAYASYPQQQQPQLYVQQGPSGFANQSDHDAYGNGGYADGATAYDMPSGGAPVSRLTQDSSYAWSGSESRWNQSGYSS